MVQMIQKRGVAVAVQSTGGIKVRDFEERVVSRPKTMQNPARGQHANRGALNGVKTPNIF
jgi:hypothetical protein